jgi:hypothetical protein
VFNDTFNQSTIGCQLDENQVAFFQDTVRAVYLVPEYSGHVLSGYSFYEGYVIDAFIGKFTRELDNIKMSASLKLLKSIIASEGKKSTAKGIPFEAVLLADLLRRKGEQLSEILAPFGIQLHGALNLCLPTTESKYDDDSLISKRPEGVFLRPSNMFWPDILAFRQEILVSPLESSYIRQKFLCQYEDKVASTDPTLFVSKTRSPH